jgi:hypothetical protein
MRAEMGARRSEKGAAIFKGFARFAHDAAGPQFLADYDTPSSKSAILLFTE